MKNKLNWCEYNYNEGCEGCSAFDGSCGSTRRSYAKSNISVVWYNEDILTYENILIVRDAETENEREHEYQVTPQRIAKLMYFATSIDVGSAGRGILRLRFKE